MRLAAILLLLCVASASAQELMDAGYGDGSLMDQDGNYYIPQPDGSFVDAYGDILTPDAPGQLVDPLGNVLELSPDSDAFASTQWKSSWGEAEHGTEGQGRWATPTTTDADASIAEAVRRGIYLDVGSGYLELSRPQERATSEEDPDDWGTPVGTDLPLTGPYPPDLTEQQGRLDAPHRGPVVDDALDRGRRRAPPVTGETRRPSE